MAGCFPLHTLVVRLVTVPERRGRLRGVVAGGLLAVSLLLGGALNPAHAQEAGGQPPPTAPRLQGPGSVIQYLRGRAGQLPSGTYFVRIRGSGFRQTRRLTVVR
ncbi:MAG: hypothetical protein BRD51_06720 [Bacteroidetes bacterium SW_11_64_17]|nr:MAG: hypothetical protein BRD51_06720 [Bacteroidetes bacterium SW_11_64_17]